LGFSFGFGFGLQEVRSIRAFAAKNVLGLQKENGVLRALAARKGGVVYIK